MTPIQVYWHTREEKWVAEDRNYVVIKVSDTKKTAKNKAMGEAQTRADDTGVTQTVTLYSKAGDYQKSVKVNPSYE